MKRSKMFVSKWVRCSITMVLVVLVSASLNLYAQSISSIKHVVQSGETVYSLAKRYKVTEKEMYDLNPGSRKSINAGSVLLIPVAVKSDDAPQSSDGMYTIQKGDTLFGTAKRFGVTTDQIKAWNPGVTESNFKVGSVIIISAKAEELVATLPLTSSHSNAVKVGLILPVGQVGPTRYVEFYEGLLMALAEMKSIGLSVDMVVERATNTHEVEQLLRQDLFKDRAIIIGGDSEASVNVLSQYAKRHGALYVSPFIRQADNVLTYADYYQINAPHTYILEALASAFVKQYNDQKVLFVSTNGRSSSAYRTLVKACSKASIKSQITSIYDLDDKLNRIKHKDQIVIVLDRGDKEILTSLLEILGDNGGYREGYHLFGYPEWQSFDEELLSELERYEATIYSTFYFNKRFPESRTFEQRYEEWFGHELNVSYPLYSVLGYDIANYFIRAYSAYGDGVSDHLSLLPSDGLQTDFRFASLGARRGYVNASLFFIRYHANQLPTKSRVY